LTKNNPNTDPQNADQYHQEERAILNYWKANKDIWITKGTKQGKEAGDSITQKNLNREGTHLNQAIVRTLPKIFTPPLSSTTESETEIPSLQPAEYSQTQLQQPQAQIQQSQVCQQQTGLPAESLEQGSHNQRRKESSSRYLARSNRRLPKYKHNLIKEHNTVFSNLQLECHEFSLLSDNIKRLGVAETNVHNLTSKHLSQNELDSLALGQKFIPTAKYDLTNLVTSHQNFTKTVRWKWIFKDSGDSSLPLYWIPSSKIPPFLTKRPTVEKLLLNLKQDIEPAKHTAYRNISTQLSKTFKALLDKPDTMVITADKNLGYTIVNTEWYSQRCRDHLYSSAYRNVTNDFIGSDNGLTATAEIFNSLRELVRSFDHELEPEEIKWILKREDWKPMKFYILAKVHKQPVKGRPIVPSMTWITHHLSQWIANQLNPLLSKLNWVLKDSNELLRTIHEINTSKHLHKLKKIEIYSADVEALYPNIDVKLGISLVNQLLTEIDWENPSRRDFLIKGIQFVLTQGFIEFENEIFQQENGAAMGSPMIPPYANIFMYMLERNTVNKHSESGFLLLYKRFIDDILVFTKDDGPLLKNLIDDLNNINPKIKLTWTNKSTNCNFLDINLFCSENNVVHSNVYQKPLNMYAYLPFHSYHTPGQKKGFIKAEALRYSRICSRKNDFLKMITLLNIRLLRRGYPLKFIESCTKNVKWEDRIDHLFNKPKNKNRVPLIYKILYSPTHQHKQLRQALNKFTEKINDLHDTPQSLREKVTICYRLPRKLHGWVLKARKKKGF
jgi:hypothetical protein